MNRGCDNDVIAGRSGNGLGIGSTPNRHSRAAGPPWGAVAGRAPRDRGGGADRGASTSERPRAVPVWHNRAMLILLTLLACTTTPEPPAEPEPEEPTSAADPVEEPGTDEAPPMGSIGGEPILPKPVVVGGLPNEAVDEGVEAQMKAINACYESALSEDPSLRGKVLVRFVIGKDGTVTDTRTKSTSLRHEATETCVNEVLAKATFPELKGGGLAIVTYPFAFPPQ